MVAEVVVMPEAATLLIMGSAGGTLLAVVDWLAVAE